MFIVAKCHIGNANEREFIIEENIDFTTFVNYSNCDSKENYF